MKTAVIYVRVSSDEQVKGTSLGTQEADCRAWCARNGYIVIAVFTDGGETAKNVDREGLQDAIDRVKAGGVGALVVWKMERVSRESIDGMLIRADLRRFGCRIISITEPTADDESGELFETMLFAWAQYDNRTRARRARRSMEAVAQAGGWTFKAPAGFLRAKRASRADLPVLMPDPKTAPAIQQALTGAANGSLSLSEARRVMIRAGLPETTASSVFRRPVYGGLLRSPITGGKEIRAAFPGLVDASTWRRAAEAVRRPARRSKPGLGAFPLAGVAVCGVCGSSIRGFLARGEHGKRYGYYDCRGGCVRAKVDVAHRDIGQIISVRWARDVSWLRKAVAQEAASQADAVRELRDSANRRRSEAEARLSRLADGYADGVLDAETYRQKSAEYREAIAKAALDAGVAQDGIDALLNGLDSIVASLADPMGLWNRLDLHGRRQFVGAFGVRLVIDEDGRCQTLAAPNAGAGEATVSGVSESDGAPTGMSVKLGAGLVAALAPILRAA
jgi:DNA invertase Pin-like site-specific DNA recombinase